MTNKRFGKRLVESLREGLAQMRAGKPMRQSTVRRMKVKGKTAYVHDTFTAPVKDFE